MDHDLRDRRLDRMEDLAVTSEQETRAWIVVGCIMLAVLLLGLFMTFGAK